VVHKVAHDIGISATPSGGLWRPAAATTRLPPMKTFRERRGLAQGLRRQQHRMRPARSDELGRFQGPPPASMTAVSRRCPIGALASAVTYLGEVPGRVQVRAWSTVTRSSPMRPQERPGSNMSTAMAKSMAAGERCRVCSWAAQNAALLLNSATDKASNGLANAALVGNTS